MKPSHHAVLAVRFVFNLRLLRLSIPPVLSPPLFSPPPPAFELNQAFFASDWGAGIAAAVRLLASACSLREPFSSNMPALFEDLCGPCISTWSFPTLCAQHSRTRP